MDLHIKCRNQDLIDTLIEGMDSRNAWKDSQCTEIIVDDINEPNNAEIVEKLWQSLSAEQRKKYADREVLMGSFTLPADFMEKLLTQ